MVLFLQVSHRNTQLLVLSGVALLAYLLWARSGRSGASKSWLEGLGLPDPGTGGAEWQVKQACPYIRTPIFNTYRGVDNSNPTNGIGVGHISNKVSGLGFIDCSAANGAITCRGESLPMLAGDIRCCAMVAYLFGVAPTLDLAWPDLSPPDLTVLSSRGCSMSIAEYPSEGLGGHLSVLRATCLVHAPDGFSHRLEDGISVGVVGQHSLQHPRVDFKPVDYYLRAVYLDNG